MSERSNTPPQPANVPYNQWPDLELPPPHQFTPRLPVSVIMPAYQTPPAVLARTLAALERQDYPRDLFEILIVDDGSDPPLEPPPSPLTLRLIRQERRGVGIARARNTGVRNAAHDIILFLDSDTMAEAGWMTAHARWHHFVSDALTVGLRGHVPADHITEDAVRRRPGTLAELLFSPGERPASVDNHLYMLRTNDLTTRSDDLFRVIVGGNFGISRAFYWEVGGHNESFARYGLEDTEFSYRVYTQGGLFAPVPDGFGWHQGPKPETDAEKQRNTRIQRSKAAHLIAHPQFRAAKPQRIYSVPRYIVTIEAGDCPAEQIIEAAGKILAGRAYDLIVRIEVSNDDPERLEWLQDTFDPDPRVRLAPTRDALDQFPASPFHIRLPASVTANDLVHRIHTKLGGAATAAATLPNGAQVTITRTWALHRAKRNNATPAHFGEARQMPPKKLKLKPSKPPTDHENPTTTTGIQARRQYLIERARDIHSPREAWWFVRWIARWCWRRLSPS